MTTIPSHHFTNFYMNCIIQWSLKWLLFAEKVVWTKNASFTPSGPFGGLMSATLKSVCTTGSWESFLSLTSPAMSCRSRLTLTVRRWSRRGSAVMSGPVGMYDEELLFWRKIIKGKYRKVRFFEARTLLKWIGILLVLEIGKEIQSKSYYYTLSKVN